MGRERQPKPLIRHGIVPRNHQQNKTQKISYDPHERVDSIEPPGQEDPLVLVTPGTAVVLGHAEGAHRECQPVMLGTLESAHSERPAYLKTNSETLTFWSRVVIYHL